jgi:DNA-binding transcriptional regulator YdaS (Cro superfamily)
MNTSPLTRAMGDMTQTQFAEHVGASQQLISYWLKTGRVGGAHVLKVEAATGISRHELRPDIFGSEPTQAAA